MIYEFESDTKIDDDILKKELGTNSDVKLKNIVRTIQKEQNAITLSAFCLRRIFAAQSGQYFARLLPAANVLPHTAQRFKSVSPLRVICSQSCLSAGNTASRK